MFEELTINGQIIYVLDGYFYTLDTIPITNLFDNISI